MCYASREVSLCIGGEEGGSGAAGDIRIPGSPSSSLNKKL